MKAFDYRKQSGRALSLHDKYVDLGANFFDDVVNKIVYLSTFSLGFITFLLSEFKENESCLLRYSFIIGTISFVVSLIFSLVFKLKSNSFFNRVSNIYYTHHTKINTYLMNSKEYEGDVPLSFKIELPEIPTSTTNEWFNFVVTFFSIGVVSYMLIIFIIFLS